MNVKRCEMINAKAVIKKYGKNAFQKSFSHFQQGYYDNKFEI